MKTIHEVLQLSVDFLEKRGIARAARDAEDLLAAELHCKRIDLFLRFESPLEEKELTGFREKIKRRGSGEPLDYILGEKEFYGCTFSLSPSVIIPRPETEILLEKICERTLREFPPSEGMQYIAWDVCTGSGCLGIPFKKRFPSWEVTLADISRAALAGAQGNATRNQVEITCLQGDFMDPFVGKKAHLLMVNPPYVSDCEYALLDREVRDFEPQEALRGGEDGLVFYRRLASQGGDFLFPGALLCLEIGATQKEAILKIFSQPFWKDIQVEKDWAGHDRFVFCRRA